MTMKNDYPFFGPQVPVSKSNFHGGSSKSVYFAHAQFIPTAKKNSITLFPLAQSGALEVP